MAAYRLSQAADADLLAIASYTRRTWGQDQALRYIAQLEEACDRLAAAPAIGRARDDLEPGLRRMQQGKHVIFYAQEPSGILIVRILHQRMSPELHFEPQ